jgi:hypothetical protein
VQRFARGCFVALETLDMSPQIIELSAGCVCFTGLERPDPAAQSVNVNIELLLPGLSDTVLVERCLMRSPSLLFVTASLAGNSRRLKRTIT